MTTESPAANVAESDVSSENIIRKVKHGFYRYAEHHRRWINGMRDGSGRFKTSNHNTNTWVVKGKYGLERAFDKDGKLLEVYEIYLDPDTIWYERGIKAWRNEGSTEFNKLVAYQTVHAADKKDALPESINGVIKTQEEIDNYGLSARDTDECSCVIMRRI